MAPISTRPIIKQQNPATAAIVAQTLTRLQLPYSPPHLPQCRLRALPILCLPPHREQTAAADAARGPLRNRPPGSPCTFSQKARLFQPPRPQLSLHLRDFPRVRFNPAHRLRPLYLHRHLRLHLHLHLPKCLLLPPCLWIRLFPRGFVRNLLRAQRHPPGPLRPRNVYRMLPQSLSSACPMSRPLALLSSERSMSAQIWRVLVPERRSWSRLT